MHRYILQLLTLLITLQGFSQAAITAKIIGPDKRPVDFATIYLPVSKQSTVSNENGDFYLIINPEIDNSVIISHLSYQPYEIKIGNNFPEIIELREGAFQLEEVIVGKQRDGYEIALNVIENLDKNHSVEPAYYEYFVRIGVYSEDWQTLNLVQEYYGILQHTKSHDTKMNLKKSRMVPYTSKGEEILNKESSIDLWATRSNNLLLYKPDFLKKSKLKKYDVSIEGSANLNGTECYVIKYSNDKGDYYDRKAMAYVDKKTYGLVKLITASHNTKADYYVERNFINIENKWYLGSVIEKHFNKKMITTLYTYLSDSKDYAKEQFPSIYSIFNEKIKSFNRNPDDSFWNNYQHIPLPEPQY